MSFKKFLVFTIFMLFVLTSYCQNIIPNGDIEGPQDFKISKEWNGKTAQWQCPHYSDTVLSQKGKTMQKKIFGNLKPHSGKAYIGIDYDSLIHIELPIALDSGKRYCFSLYFNMKNKNYVKDQITFALLFPYNSVWRSLNYITDKTSTDSTDWTRLCGTTTAKGGEKYIMLMNYNFNEKSKFKNKEMIYFDDFSLEINDEDNDCCPEMLHAKPGDAITLKELLFKTSSDIIEKSLYTELNRLAIYLKQNKEFKIQINGHTDNVGNAQSNMELSKNRAKSVYDYLINKGIKAERMKFEGFGSSKPIALNNTEENKAKNRRVEIVFAK